MAYDREGIARMLARNVAVTLATEPLADKDGCTTRRVDIAPSARLEYFIVGAVNVIWPFHDLALTILRDGHQPTSIFRYALEAQELSIRNRGGGKVTFGQTLLLIPLVAAHALAIASGQGPAELGKLDDWVRIVLAATTQTDVADLEAFCLAALGQSRTNNERLGKEREYPNPRFVGRYSNFLEAATEPAFARLSITQEVVAAYPESRGIVASWSGQRLLPFTEAIYPTLRDRLGRFDVAADIIAAGMYLIISAHPENELF